MTSGFYGVLIPATNSAVQKSSSSQVSIGWWLVPSVMTYLLAILFLK
jgi:hypothetical protein